jgi:uncharacterized membrane protein YfcA
MYSTLINSSRAVVKHLKKGDVNWPMVMFLSLVHIAGKA